MSPTVRHDPAIVDLDVVRDVRAPRGARVFSVTLLVLALGLVVVLAADGHALPSAGALLLLAIPLALCMNRYLLFPNEIGVTADAAVLFAAMVALRGDAQWLGPLVLALLVGPLDARHWGARAFARMAYNSGSTAVVTAAGLAVFVPVAHALGSGWEATLGAALLAAVPYVAAESVLGITLVTLLGERPGRAARHQLPLNSIALPLAAFGAIAGFAADGVGWWLTFLLLLPVPLVPELVFVVVPRSSARVARLAALGGLLLLSTPFVPGAISRSVAGIAALGFLVSAECRSTGSHRLMPLLWVPAAAAVGAASAVLGSGDRVLATVGVAVVTAAAVVAMADGRGPRAGWTLPAVALGACLAGAWSVSGRSGPIVFCVGAGLAALLAAACGPLPWPSRGLGPFVAHRHMISARAVLLGVGALTVVSAVVASRADLRPAAALATTVLLEALVTCAAGATRLWRFAPRRRVRDVVVLAVVCVGGLVLLLPAALDGARTTVPYATAGVVATIVVAWNARAPRESVDSPMSRAHESP